ncbi:MAG TPA: TIGR02680 family protein [Polyangia bacterium]|nr:TIGR02680 family protein [Polyangia bacterium]
MSAPLPAPGRERFQPLRSGLVNIYRYDDQEFWFEDGHLLLRGNNGTGKSRVLALQLPFLFDGEVAPHRMEPDGDPAKRVEWNLLMGGRHPDRMGYTWVEFGRRAPEAPGGEEFVTLGCGLSAVGGRGLTGKWFFITRQRIGRDLFLVTSAGHALSRDRLDEAIGEAGSVHTTAAAYRDEVDRALFGLGRYRYEALVNLLVQLRQPQLSRQLDEDRLSMALSEALPPPSPQMVADVAEAFRGLEGDEEALTGFRAALGAVEQFLVEYRRYAQIAARRRAQVVRGKHSAYEASMRRLREAERDLGQATIEEGAVATARAQARVDEESALATVEALAASPAMQDAQALRRAREATERAIAELQRWQAEAERRIMLRARRDRELDEARAAAQAADADLTARGHRLQVAAATAGVASRNAAVTAPLAAAPAVLDGPELLRALASLLDDRRRALRRLRELDQHLRRAESALAHAEAAVNGLTADVDEAATAQKEAAAACAEVLEKLVAAYRGWASAARLLMPPGPEAIIDALGAWADDPSARGPIAATVSASLAAALDRMAGERAAADAGLAEQRARLTELRDEEAHLFSGGHHPPPTLPTRDPGPRLVRPGAPLWRLVDFSPEVSPDARAGLEAALDAAGLLDAWITPEGELLPTGENDAVLVADGASLPGDAHLGTVLVPAVDRRDPLAASVSDEVVTAMLARIGLGGASGATNWVDVEGRFRLGPLDGRFTKSAAAHIGEGARAAARRRRLDELAALITAVAVEERASLAEIAAIEHRRAAAQAEAEAAPDDQQVRVAAAELEARGRALRMVRARLAEAQGRAIDARAERQSRRLARDEAAGDLGLRDLGDDLVPLEDAIATYGAEIAALGPALKEQRGAHQRATDASAAADEARVEEEAARAQSIETEAQAAAQAAERDVLETSVGAAAEEILTRYSEAQRYARALRAARNELGARERQAIERTARARAEIESATAARDNDERERDVAAAALVRLAGARLINIAVPALSVEAESGWSTTRTVEVARTLEANLERIDASDAAWERSGKGLFAQVQTLEQSLLPYGHQATTTLIDDLVAVDVPFQGRVHSMAQFGEILAAEVTSRQMLLSAREREILENHLVGEVSMHLHDRLHAAESLVRKMNEELSARPMSTGMTLRFAWKPIEDGPPGLPEARSRLMRAGGTWSPAEREALGSFLSKRIADVRAAELGGTWQDHLAEALDYRRWHHFGVERMLDGSWKPLTRRTHGTGSGGEKAVALTLPQFAAAAAHYRSADRKAPRLILLDEVFVGVDSDMRSKCMGLLATFDLDFMMTSEREWGCYPTLPAAAIYQLAARPEIDAVGVTRFAWNGRERTRAEVAAPGARAPQPETAADHSSPSLTLSDQAEP